MTKPTNTGNNDYQSKEHETVDRWEDSMLLNIIPENEASARKYLGAANKFDCRTEVKEHFAACIKRVKEKTK